MERDNKYAAEWLAYADTDLAVAEHNQTMYPKPLNIICFHCQQAVEKYLKAYLSWRGIKPPKIHELETLCNMCSAQDNRFDEILKQCVFLSVYGVQPRYPLKLR